MNKFIEFIKRIFKLEERVNNIIHFGVIKEVDISSNLVVVDLGNSLESPKLPYLVSSSGNAMVYFVPKIGDQVMVLSPNGEITKAVAMPSIYKGNVAVTEKEWRLEFDEGSIKYDAGKITITANTEVKVDALKIVLAGEDGGGVVCQNNLCSFTGAFHPEGSTKVLGGK